MALLMAVILRWPGGDQNALPFSIIVIVDCAA
jgi:hypothetical protein